MGNGAGAISGPASVLPDVGVVHAGDHQHAHSLPEHVGGDARTRVQLLALEAPGDGDRHVAMRDSASKLSKRASIHNIRSKGEGNNSRWF